VKIIDIRRSVVAARPTKFILYCSVPVLTVLGALVSVTVPRVLGPVQYGQYSLVESVFRYGVAFDLGLSVLVDRRLPIMQTIAGNQELSAFSSAILWLRLYIGIVAASLGALLLSLLSFFDVLPFSWILGATALTAGLLGMIVYGPTSIERALSRRRQFGVLYAGGMSVLAFGRLIGVLAGGVMGCFAVMAGCYLALAIYSHLGMLHSRERSAALAVRASFNESAPLFVTLYAFTLLLTANRWVVASRADADSFGHFAFGASVTTLLVGLVGGITQLWYPRLVRHHAMGQTIIVSWSILRDMAVLALAAGSSSAVAIWASPWMIELVFPDFGSSLPVLRTILPSFAATTISTWLLPLLLATGARPWL
jgi:O-antigen/teichoic acid export membrane protein